MFAFGKFSDTAVDGMMRLFFYIVLRAFCSFPIADVAWLRSIIKEITDRGTQTRHSRISQLLEDADHKAMMSALTYDKTLKVPRELSTYIKCLLKGTGGCKIGDTFYDGLTLPENVVAMLESMMGTQNHDLGQRIGEHHGGVDPLDNVRGLLGSELHKTGVYAISSRSSPE